MKILEANTNMHLLRLRKEKVTSIIKYNGTTNPIAEYGVSNINGEEENQKSCN